MVLEFEHRPSESAWIERVWRSRSTDTTAMTSVARASWDLVFWEAPDGVHAGIQGAESRASEAPVPAFSEFLGVRLARGTLVPAVSAPSMLDSFVDLPTEGGSFWLAGHWVRIPRFDEAEEFVRLLARRDMLARADTEHDDLRSRRTQQRRYLAATGLPHRTIRQIERATDAAVRLQEGGSPAAVAHELGYFDQPHLARSLRRFIGRSATELTAGAHPELPLSLLYKTDRDEAV